MNTKQELHRLIDLLPQDDEAEALDYLRWLLAADDTLSEDERAAVRAGEAEIERGEYVTLEDLIRSLDP